MDYAVAQCSHFNLIDICANFLRTNEIFHAQMHNFVKRLLSGLLNIGWIVSSITNSAWISQQDKILHVCTCFMSCSLCTRLQGARPARNSYIGRSLTESGKFHHGWCLHPNISQTYTLIGLSKTAHTSP